LSAMVHEIDAARGENNLSSAVRQFVLQQYLELSQRHQAGAGGAAVSETQPLKSVAQKR
jgi:predicted DNA-binding ribbon-helix-helix protein